MAFFVGDHDRQASLPPCSSIDAIIREEARAAVFLRTSGRIARALRLVIARARLTTELMLQGHHVASLGCDIAQGFLIGKPLPGDELLRLVTSRTRLRVAAT